MRPAARWVERGGAALLAAAMAVSEAAAAPPAEDPPPAEPAPTDPVAEEQPPASEPPAPAEGEPDATAEEADEPEGEGALRQAQSERVDAGERSEASEPAEPKPRKRRLVKEDPSDVGPGLTWLGWAGVAAASAGALTLGAGVGLAVADPRITSDSEPGNVRQVNTQPVGWALIGVGGALMLGGLVRVIIDRVPRTRRTAFAPFGGRRGGGASVRVRF